MPWAHGLFLARPGHLAPLAPLAPGDGTLNKKVREAQVSEASGHKFNRSRDGFDSRCYLRKWINGSMVKSMDLGYSVFQFQLKSKKTSCYQWINGKQMVRNPAKIMDFVGGQVPKIHHEYAVLEWMKTPDGPDPGASRCWWHGYPHANVKQHKKTWMVVDYSPKKVDICWYPLVNELTQQTGKIQPFSSWQNPRTFDWAIWLQCTIGRFFPLSAERWHNLTTSWWWARGTQWAQSETRWWAINGGMNRIHPLVI